MLRGSLAVLGLAALLAVAPGAEAKPKGGIAATVYAGPVAKPAAKQLSFDQFFSANVTIRRGQSVRWLIRGFHNVYFPASGQSPPPFVTATPSTPVSGISDAAGAPFWFNGLPSLNLSPQAVLPAGSGVYDGTTAVNSGASAVTPKPFLVKFTRTGTFRYYCLIHPGMTGIVHVVAPGRRVPSAAQQAAVAVRQQRAQTTLASRLGKVHPPAKTVLLGNDSGGVTWLRFFPSVLNVKVGDAVTFKMASTRENHTVTFGPVAYTNGIEKGLIQIDTKTTPPTFSLNPLAAYPSDPLTSGLPPYTGSNHGNGFENSGLLTGQAGTGLPTTVTFRFTKAGTFHFECLIHPGMDGTVHVT